MRTQFKRGLTVCVVVTSIALAASSANAVSRASAPDDPVHSDFNGDGIEDVAVGSPSEKVNGQSQAGMVHVLYGSTTGLRGESSQMFTQATPNVSGAPQARDFFGLTLAAGDFDDDGHADLAIGVPREDISGKADAGSVEILYGSSSGLTAATHFTYKGTVGGSSHCTCRFGEALAAGDFDGDGVADLAIGAPQTPKRDVLQSGNLLGRDSGEVVVLYGTRGSAGLSAAGATRLRAPRDWVDNIAQYLAFTHVLEFGAALAAGDHNGDGRDELAVGIPGFATFVVSAPRADEGQVAMYDGTASGLSTSPQGAGTLGGPTFGPFENGARFGAALAFGNFDGNGRDELVVGAPGEELGSHGKAGAVYVYDRNRPRRQFSQVVLAGSAADPDDQFGYALATGDFNGDGRDELVVAAPFENFSGSFDAGIVHVLRGTSDGLTTDGAKIFHQDKPNMAGAAESGDAFGRAVATGNVNGDIFGTRGRDDLVIGVPVEKVAGKERAGLIHVLFGSSSGVNATGSQTFTQDSAGVADAVGIGDNFGASFR
jgi:hypothetical protein